jgi:hypothetical protein
MSEEDNKNNIVRIAYRDKVSVVAMKEIIQVCFQEKLKNAQYEGDKCSSLAKNIADSIKNRLKSLQYDRYKYIVQIYIGERRDQGVRVGSRCYWDSNSDNQATETFMNVFKYFFKQ